MKMLYAEITVRVYLDEKRLTKSQQEVARKADTDIKIDHPIDKGCEDLRAIIKTVGMTRFQYLGFYGINAVRLVIGEID